MSIAPLRISGTSAFSANLQTILDRAVNIASIPLTALQNDQAELLSKKQLLSDLGSAAAGLGASVAALGKLGQSRAISATSSNANRVDVSVTGTVGAGSHLITDITSVARAASATSLNGYADADAAAVSSDAGLELVVGTQTYTLDLSAAGANTLEGLRDAINGLGAGVTAAVINTGNGATPYYLSLTSDATGEKAFELRETAGRADTNLLANARPEANAAYSSNAAWADTGTTAVSPDGLLQLSAGGSVYSIDLSGANTLAGLRDAINLAGAGVTAEIVDAGALVGASRYRLKITSGTGDAVELRETAGDATSNVLTNAHQGTNAIFKFDGLQVVKADNVVSDVLSGLSFTIRSETGAGEDVVISLASSRGTLAGALQSLVSSYNAAAEKANAQIGESAGGLSGSAIVRELQSGLRALNSYSGDGETGSLASLGITLDQQGVMSFDSSAFYALSNGEIASAFDLLGSESSGLGTLASRFTSLSDPVTGLIRLEQDQYDRADDRLSDQVSALTERISLMQTTLSRQLAQADTLLTLLESQANMLDASIQGLNLTLYGKQTG